MWNQAVHLEYGIILFCIISYLGLESHTVIEVLTFITTLLPVGLHLRVKWKKENKMQERQREPNQDNISVCLYR